MLSAGTPAAPTVAIIPARGGSKGVPGKNLRTVGGRTLVARAVEACRAAASVDLVVVTTDDPAITAAARAAGAEVVARPAELAGDTASSESALLHALAELADRGQHPEVVVFVQCTSPFVDPADLDRAAALVAAGEADSVFAAVASHAFLWRPVSTDSAEVTGVNHDPARRPRRQDRQPDYRETGAFYAMTTAGLRRHRHRFFGRTRAVEVAEAGAVDVDTEHDLLVAAALATVLEPPPTTLDVDAVVTDFDGVHTDDAAYVDSDGRESVRVSRADGLGVARLRRAGVPLLILSSETNPVVRARAAKLGVEVRQGVDDKATAVRAWLAERGLDPARVAYLGNDVNDCPAMVLVGWPVAVADARSEVRRLARLTLRRPGGAGAVRELCELVLAARAAAGDPQPRSAAAPADRPVPPATAATARSVAAAAGRVLAEIR